MAIFFFKVINSIRIEIFTRVKYLKINLQKSIPILNHKRDMYLYLFFSKPHHMPHHIRSTLHFNYEYVFSRANSTFSSPSMTIIAERMDFVTNTVTTLPSNFLTSVSYR